jgi:short-subunit dehydrogenase
LAENRVDCFQGGAPVTKLTDKVVIITGASSGIGAEVALQAAQKGAVPVLLARSLDKLETVRDRIKEQTNISPYIYRLNVSDTKNVQSVFEAIKHELKTIDILVNNAGFGLFDYFADVKMEDVESMFSVNVTGLMACTKMVLPTMIENNRGHIMNIASQAGKIPTPKSTVYSATKHAVLGFTNGLRMEVADNNIYVTSVNPGPINTNFFHIADQSGDYAKNVQKFMLQPDTVAKKIVKAMEHPVREINLPKSMNTGSKLYQIFPRIVEQVAGKLFNSK